LRADSPPPGYTITGVVTNITHRPA